MHTKVIGNKERENSYRSQEYGPGQSKDIEATEDWEIITDNIIGIADAIGSSQNG